MADKFHRGALFILLKYLVGCSFISKYYTHRRLKRKKERDREREGREGRNRVKKGKKKKLHRTEATRESNVWMRWPAGWSKEHNDEETWNHFHCGARSEKLVDVYFDDSWLFLSAIDLLPRYRPDEPVHVRIRKGERRSNTVQM